MDEYEGENDVTHNKNRQCQIRVTHNKNRQCQIRVTNNDRPGKAASTAALQLPSLSPWLIA